jgi:hypothetical protein
LGASDEAAVVPLFVASGFDEVERSAQRATLFMGLNAKAGFGAAQQAKALRDFLERSY